MKRIAPDVERLMWLIAEDRDPRAIADFEARFPDLKADLAKHFSMVKGLKKAGKKIPPHQIPRFTPRYETRTIGFNRTVAFALAIVVTIVAVGAFSIAAYVLQPSPKPPAPPPDVVVNPPKPPATVYTPPPKTIVPSPETGAGSSPQTERVAADDPLLSPITLKVDHAPLVAAIEMVCRQAKLSADVGPGLSTADVSLDYEGEPAMQVLQDLGQKWGFTPLADERGKVLIIPVRPDGSAASPGKAGTDTGAVGTATPQKIAGVGQN